MSANLQSKLSEMRVKEREATLRAAELGEKAATDEGLNTEERAELGEVETTVTDLRARQTDLERSLKVGNFSSSANGDVGLNDKEIREFSLVKLFRAAAPGASRSDIAAAEFELEACDAQAKELGVEARGTMIPFEVMHGNKETRKANTQERRDMIAGAFGSGGAMVGVDSSRPLIELLRNAQLLPSLGATILTGLQGDVAINKQTGGGTAYWVDGDGVEAITKSQQSLGQVTMTPKYLGAMTNYSRKLLNQSSIGVEQFIRADQMSVLGLEKDRVAFHGNAESGQPVGIINTTGINTVDFASASNPTRAEVIAMRTAIASDNAMAQNVSFASNSLVIGNLMNRPIDAGSGLFLMNDAGLMIGKTVAESNQLLDDFLLYGNYADFIMGEWGTLDFIIDTYTLATTLMTRVIAIHACDSAVRHAESFASGSSTYGS